MNLDNLLQEEELVARKNEIKRIFFYRVCGTGMGACACLLKEAGYEVSGADQNFYPPMSDYLKTTGIALYHLNDVNKEFLQQFDLVIVGNSVPRNSEHAELIESCGVAFTSFPSILGAFVLREKKVIGIAGTHGKTTTTNFLKSIFNNMQIDCGYFIGGILDDAPPAQIGKSKYFVIESDEYDSAYFQKIAKFRLYELNKMILTSLEFDHADIYNSVEEIEKEFQSILPQLEQVVADGSYESIQKIKTDSWLLYSEGLDAGPYDMRVTSSGSSFSVRYHNESFEFETNIVGAHNILNITSCILILFDEGFAYEEIGRAVKSLGLVKRRQEERGYFQEALVIDDFAHHPRAIHLTLEALKVKYPDKRIVTIFEPISATARSNHFQREFAECFDTSNEVIIAQNTLSTTAKGKDNLDCEKLISDLNGKNIPSSIAKNLDELLVSIKEKSEEGTLLVILSNRSCLGLWESDFVQNLRS